MKTFLGKKIFQKTAIQYSTIATIYKSKIWIKKIAKMKKIFWGKKIGILNNYRIVENQSIFCDNNLNRQRLARMAKIRDRKLYESDNSTEWADIANHLQEQDPPRFGTVSNYPIIQIRQQQTFDLKFQFLIQKFTFAS